MRGGIAELLLFHGAMNCMPLLGEENGMRHWRVVPLLRVPDLVHGGGGVRARGRRIAGDACGHRPGVRLHPVDKDRHLLGALVDIDDDRGLGRLRRLVRVVALGGVEIGLAIRIDGLRLRGRRVRLARLRFGGERVAAVRFACLGFCRERVVALRTVRLRFRRERVVAVLRAGQRRRLARANLRRGGVFGRLGARRLGEHKRQQGGGEEPA